ncbi:MAG TPA: TolC family protein [Planctomycetota bacterium]|nr:TolC family protein [Planctomycetota bacterium]
MASCGRGCRFTGLLLALAAGAASCCKVKPEKFRGDADREVYHILSVQQAKVLGTSAGFSIEPASASALARFAAPMGPAASEKPLSAADVEGMDKGNGLPPQEGVVRLALRDSLELAARHSRDYQTRKEDLYLAALALTLERFRWKPQWSGTLAANATDSPGSTSAGVGSNFSVSRLLDLGGQVTASLATDLLRFSTGDPRTTATSLLAFEYLQPLCRRSGRLVAREALTQAERDVVYAIRTFERFRRSFCVDVTSGYYRVLQQRDTVMNQWSNYKRIRQSRVDAEKLEKEGEMPPLQVDQTRQDELRAEANWVRAARQYREQLDEFKVLLGLPAEAHVEFDPTEVERLREAGLRDVGLSPETAVATALGRRLDLLTAVDRLADAERAVAIAANGLQPDVDLKLAASVPTKEPTQFLRFEPSRGTYAASLTAELPLRRVAERNTYRQALVGLERAQRAAEDLREQVKLAVRQAWRTLQEATASYRIERDSVALAQQRERASRELIRLGEATARDLLEANEALVEAQNALTRALVDHALARLALWRDTELLRVSEDGVWQEVSDGNP